MSLLEQDITRKGRVDKITSRLEFESDGNGKEYKVEAIFDNVVYARELEGHLPAFYYLVLWKGYPKKENTWEPASVVIHLRKLISNFYYDHLEKPTATSSPINSAPPMAKPIVKLGVKTLSKPK